MKNHFIYVIGTTDCPVKIGRATNVQGRLKALQSGQPDELKIHHTQAVPSWASCYVETAAHHAFKDRHRRGEWFDVTAAEAAAYLRAEADVIVANIKLKETPTVECIPFFKRMGLDAATTKALDGYRDLLLSPFRADELKRVNRIIESAAGMLALTAVQQAFLQRRDMAIVLQHHPKALRNAQQAILAAALVLRKIAESKGVDISKEMAA